MHKISFLLYLLLIIPLIFFHNCYYSFFIKVINPFFSLLFIVFYFLTHKNILTFKNKYYLPLIILISLLFGNIYLGLGFIKGFIPNPYNNLITNIFETIIPLISLEILRYLFLKNKKNKPFFITLCFITLEINYHTLFSLNLKKDLFTYLCSHLIPLIFSNFLFTYLTQHFHYIYAIILSILDKLIIYFVPLIPYHNWYFNGSNSLIKIIFIYLIFSYILNKNKQKKKHYNISFFLPIIISFLLTFFNLGLFKYEAIVILSNSMAPTFQKGDIVIYEKTKENVSVNDIIIYEIPSKTIIHRVVKKKSNNTYLTKGDNNKIIDNYTVKEKDIKGIYKFSLKYLGLPAVFLDEYFQEGDD